MNYFTRVLKYGINYSYFGLLNILFNILYAIFSALAFVSFIPMLDVLFKQTEIVYTKPEYTGIGNIREYLESYFNYYLSNQLETDVSSTLIIVVGIVVFFFLMKNIFNYLALYNITFVKNGLLKNLRENLYSKVLNMPISYFLNKKKGDLMSRITADILEIQTSYLSILELMVREPLTILFTLIVMFTISPRLTLFVTLFIPISGFIISIIGKKLRKDSKEVQQQQSNFLSIIDETISGQKVIKSFLSESFFLDKFKSINSLLFKFSNKVINRKNLAGPFSEFMGILVIGVLLWFGGKMVLISETISGTTFIVFMGLAYNILTPAKNLSKSFYSIKKGNAAAERVFEIIEYNNDRVDQKRDVELIKFENKITFENIEFNYGDSKILDKISFTINKGESVALVGSSGSGKTTIANILNGFFNPKSGNLLIDNNNISQITKESLYKNISIVTQESILFNDSILNNIKIGNLDSKKEDVINAAKEANAHEFIEQQLDGYNTMIGDYGNKLSGGQKQRLTIARAMLKSPSILILDEATSSLDSKSEKKIQDAINKLMQGKTSLIIAHKFSTIKKCDKIILIDKGKIIAQGTHEELINSNSSYKNMNELQI
ncbi:ABC transporter ATP-binding protein/permease [Flavobacteriaceae bacterium]|jgi:subfamily B ATP-binding cassette protein MsbA|nr:ABC transporter ATP-binding protein/permease [Flavobacteriaceae bacterium]MDA9818586.1 ABC transporter ATP-binding protein/permease [Flavobacteriaceae bacterium]MDA9883275.1 ABC transporter ATP-binding protein/permease [Flavobacteriaceae bacterium]MDC3297505.1 ABC transporter ATP-binding protein/permease [Flavobacteriaceae bacterium]